jgi:ABC-2 type transport system ATP-binding protein
MYPGILVKTVASILQVSNLSKRFGRNHALSGVSFRVQEGEILGLIGPNGAGKTTLFECLAGLLPYDSGVITGNREMFYVPDGIAPWPAQRLRWALDFAVGYFGGKSGLKETVIEQLGLRDFLDQPIGSLSKGQRKRGLIAIGLLTPQPLLLIDEPLDGLDLRQMRDTAQVLRAHAAALGKTLFLSIHHISDAARFCDRFVLLSGGTVRGEGTTAELAARAGKPLDGLEEVFLALT